MADEFRDVKNPKALKSTTISADDENLQGGVDSAAGLSVPAGQDPAQLDIRWRQGNTYVQLMRYGKDGKPKAEDQWKFAGTIAPEDVRDHWQANNLPPAPTTKTVQ